MLRPARLLAALFPLALLLAAPAAAQPGDDHAAAKKKARTAAQSWLDHTDAAEFGESWDAAAALLQNRVARADWVRKAERLRDTVQTVSDRTLTRTQYRDSLQRAPSGGPFVLLKYRSASAAGRVEELVLTVRQDTTWKVTGYRVTPLRPASGRSASAPPRSSNP